MDHIVLVDFLLKADGCVALGCLPVYYHFEKKTELAYGIAKDFEDAVNGLRRSLARELADLLNPVFENTPVTISVAQEGYSEKASNPVGSEPYREALARFIEERIDAIKDYRVIKEHCTGHRIWLKRIIRLISLLLLLSGGSVIGLYLLEKVFTVTVWNYILFLQLAGLITLIIGIACCDELRRRNLHLAMDLRSKYEAL